MSDPQDRWDEQLRAALIERARAVETVTPWTPPAEHRRSGRLPWRWLTPLAAAAVVALIVIGAAVTRLSAGRDAGPASPAPPAPTTITATAAPTTPSSSRARVATSATRTPAPVVPGPTTVTPAGPTVTSAPSTTTPAPPTVASTPSGPASTTTSAGRNTTPSSPSATITPCQRNHTYESLTAEWSGVHGTQFSGLSELARCGGFDDVNWFPTGHPFLVRLGAATRIFVVRPGSGDQALPLAAFANYLSHPYTGLFLVTGPRTNPTTLTEIYHP